MTGEATQAGLKGRAETWYINGARSAAPQHKELTVDFISLVRRGFFHPYQSGIL